MAQEVGKYSSRTFPLFGLQGYWEIKVRQIFVTTLEIELQLKIW